MVVIIVDLLLRIFWQMQIQTSMYSAWKLFIITYFSFNIVIGGMYYTSFMLWKK